MFRAQAALDWSEHALFARSANANPSPCPKADRLAIFELTLSYAVLVLAAAVLQPSRRPRGRRSPRATEFGRCRIDHGRQDEE